MISIRFRHFLLPAYFLPVYFLLVLVWIGGQTTPGLANEVDFEADSVEVNRDEGVIIATGNVILRQADETLYTDRLIYNEAADLAIAIGKVRLIQGDGGATLSDRMELSEQFTRMIARPLISSFEDGTRFAAREGEAVQGEQAIYRYGRYTPCKCDWDEGEQPIWEIRSSRIVHDMQSRTIRHENMRLHIFNLPFFWLPVLAHPDWTVNRRSGFLGPRYSYSTDLGTVLSVPWFQVLGPTRDVEIEPVWFQHRGNAAKITYRERWNNFDLDANLYTGELETYKKSRERVAGIDARLTGEMQGGWRVAGQLQRASQDTFLRRYGFLEDTSLESKLSAEKVTRRRYYRVAASDMQGLSSSDTRDKEPTILPFVQYEYERPTARPGTSMRTRLSALQLDNDNGHEMQRWTGMTEFIQTREMIGGRTRLEAGFTGSYHNIEQRADGKTKLGELGRGHSHVSADWQAPIEVKLGNQPFLLTPRLKATHIGGADRTDDIPNRDSSDFRLDEANIFLIHRFQGEDYYLPGARLDGGISLWTESAQLGQISGFLGLSRRLSGKTATGLTAKARSDYSDYVASLRLDPPGPLSLSFAGRADQHNFKLNESRSTLALNFADTKITITHAQLSSAYFTSTTEDLEEAKITATQQLPGGWSLQADQVWNLSSGESRRDSSTVKLAWTGGFQDCVTLSLDYKRVPGSDRDIRNIDELQLLLNFKYLGSISQSNLKSGFSSN